MVNEGTWPTLFGAETPLDEELCAIAEKLGLETSERENCFDLQIEKKKFRFECCFQ